MLFLPLSPEALSAFYRLHYFCGCFLTGFETALIVNLFTEKTTVLHVTVAYAVTLTIPVLLQNDFIHIPFGIFRLVIVIACAMQLYFFWKLPGKTWPRYVAKSDGLICPKSFFTGVYFLEGLTVLMTFFALAIAETVSHGLFVLFISSMVYWSFVYYLWNRRNDLILRCVSVLIGLAAIGFVLAIVSLYYPPLLLLSCALLGAGYSAFIIQLLYGVIMAKLYPSRYIAPGFIGLCFIAILIHSGLLKILRNNLPLMYTIYLVIAVVLVVLFYMLMPYLTFFFRGRSLREIFGPPQPDESAGTEETKPAIKPPPLVNDTMRRLTNTAFEPLTSREYDVAELIVLGVRQQIIAEKLNIQTSTVKFHRNNIYSKFGVNSRDELLRRIEQVNQMSNEK
jgi:DNA-binding CsgD family transcriptional regulator